MILEQKPTIVTSQNCCLFLKARKVSKNKSQKIGMFQKPKFPEKDKVFEETWRFKKN